MELHISQKIFSVDHISSVDLIFFELSTNSQVKFIAIRDDLLLYTLHVF
jgi:hypothetical protein